MMQKQKVKKENNEIKVLKEKDLNKYFENTKTKQQRNISIIKAYEDGYRQVEIASLLNVSKSLISKIINKGVKEDE